MEERSRREIYTNPGAIFQVISHYHININMQEIEDVSYGVVSKGRNFFCPLRLSNLPAARDCRMTVCC